MWSTKPGPLGKAAGEGEAGAVVAASAAAGAEDEEAAGEAAAVGAEAGTVTAAIAAAGVAEIAAGRRLQSSRVLTKSGSPPWRAPRFCFARHYS